MSSPYMYMYYTFSQSLHMIFMNDIRFESGEYMIYIFQLSKHTVNSI